MLTDVQPRLAERAEVVDRCVVAGYEGRLAPAFPQGLTLLAVGGYGRRELFPYSDVDLLLLVEAAPTAAQSETIALFLRDLWDQKLRVSQSVRTVDECARLQEGNVELLVSLLDRRRVIGDDELWARLQGAMETALPRQRRILLEHLVMLTRARHKKAQGTIYHLEPDLKDGPGGLRDLHVLRWMSMLREKPVAGEAQAAWPWLAAARVALHEKAGRDANVLSFAMQDELTPVLDYPAPEVLMRDYYQQARAVFRPCERELEAVEESGQSLRDQFREWRTRLSTAEFTVSRERVYLRAPHQLERDGGLALRLFAFVARHGIRVAADTERWLHTLLPPALASLEQQGPLWPKLEAVLSLPHAAMAVRTMQITGWWNALLPEWQRIDCLVSRDFYHRYTVDEHTLVTLDTVEALAQSKDSAHRRLQTLSSELDQPAALRLALLLHDIGKGEGERHAEKSERIAKEVGARWGVPERTRSLVEFLIARHLELSSVMTSRDLEERAVVEQVAERVETIERLKYLTFLTYCDISAVHPGAMTPWRLEQLWRTYVLTLRELTRELETDRIGQAEGLGAEFAEFLAGFPTRYQRTHSASEIQEHAELAQKAAEKGVAAEISKLQGTYRAVVATMDRPALFASLAGTLASFGMNIVRAEAFRNRQGLVLDTFDFADPLRSLELNPSEKDRLRRMMEQAAMGKLDVEKLLRSRRTGPRPGKLQAAVTTDPEASANATLFEIVAEDRPGLLYDLAAAITRAGANIEVVLIDTEAHKALDVFYVTHGGAKLSPDSADALRTELQRVCG